MKTILAGFSCIFLFYVVAFCAVGCVPAVVQEEIYSSRCERVAGTPYYFEVYHFRYEGSEYLIAQGGGGIAITPINVGIESTPDHQVIYGK